MLHAIAEITGMKGMTIVHAGNATPLWREA